MKPKIKINTVQVQVQRTANAAEFAESEWISLRICKFPSRAGKKLAYAHNFRHTNCIPSALQDNKYTDLRPVVFDKQINWNLILCNT